MPGGRGGGAHRSPSALHNTQQKRTLTVTLSASWSWDLLCFTGQRLVVGGWWGLAVGGPSVLSLPKTICPGVHMQRCSAVLSSASALPHRMYIDHRPRSRLAVFCRPKQRLPVGSLTTRETSFCSTRRPCLGGGGGGWHKASVSDCLTGSISWVWCHHRALGRA